MMSHRYRKLDIAREFKWSVLALCGAEGMGPSVRIEQCTDCGDLKVVSEERYELYAFGGTFTSMPRDCPDRQESSR